MILKAYLKKRLKLLALLCAFALIFALVLWASALPAGAVGYAALLCAALGLLAGTLDFFAFCRAHRALADMRGRVSVSLDGLPQTGDFIQADWRALVLEAHQACRAAEERAAAQRREADDYYTLWAHQIKTPIAALELLLQDPQGPHVQALAAELVKVEQYVDMALNFMRLEGEGSDLVISRCALAPIVKAAVRRYARLFILKGIRLELGSLEGEALTDGKWLGFALEQLISNAVKYTPSGGHVRIWVQEGPAVLVEDDGPGIPPQDLPRVFDRGYTGLAGRTGAHSTGIGLYLTRKALNALGHAVSLSSQPGHGVCAKVDLWVKPLDPD